jgi:predicted metal-binding membrane protein
MTSIAGLANVTLPPRQPLADSVSRHPEWWALTISAAAWLSIVTGFGHSGHGRMHDHVVLRQLAEWIVMTAAMMIPMTVPAIRTTAQRSFWKRRHRASAWFLIGYVGLWTAAGIAVSLLPVQAGSGAAAIAFAAAAVWQLTRWKRRAVVACHWRMPLAPRGWRSDRDCLLYGWRSGLRCSLSCGLLMLACALAGHSPLATAVGTGVALAERYAVRDQRLLAAALLSVSLFFGAL